MEPLTEFEWNFEAVPDKELVACCYWEYARESGFICGVRKRCMEDMAGRGKRLPLHTDLQKIQSIGRSANIFLRGFFCPRDGMMADALPLPPGEVRQLTGNFPKPWQSLTKEERQFRSHELPRGFVDPVQLLPFRHGSLYDARQIVATGTSLRFLRDQEYARLRKEHPNASEDELLGFLELGNDPLRPSVVYESGWETTVVQIHWGAFTNDEIVKSFRDWVKVNRLKGVHPPDRKGSNKTRDRRVALERLGMMRLLHRFRLRDMAMENPEAWKLYRKREWYKERKRAGEMFRRLFPFLDTSDRPLSWATQGGRSR